MVRLALIPIKPSVPNYLSGCKGKGSDYRLATKNIEISVGESLRIKRELQELSQSALAKITRIPQGTISAIENNRVAIGIKRAKVFARALKVHPAVIVFPGWEVDVGKKVA